MTLILASQRSESRHLAVRLGRAFQAVGQVCAKQKPIPGRRLARFGLCASDAENSALSCAEGQIAPLSFFSIDWPRDASATRAKMEYSSSTLIRPIDNQPYGTRAAPVNKVDISLGSSADAK